ncbi:ABC-ATPase domain-containing protein [Streptococcus sp. H49]|uniref:ABC-ATPase domain-containing protein n=1 Tax=Streptococcus huangxiaojuni TaxID=3237239 RepID=UPI0034A299A5
MSDTALRKRLLAIDGKGYGAYKSLAGSYDYPVYRLFIDHIQADPYAPPSKLRLLLRRSAAGLPDNLLSSHNKRRAVSDFLNRSFAQAVRAHSKDIKAVGGKGDIAVDACGQEILDKTAVLIHPHSLEVRFTVNLPAAGRRIMGVAADKLLNAVLPQIVKQSLFYQNIDQKGLQGQVRLFLDQLYIREELRKRDLVAFIGNGSLLARASGVSDLPLKSAVPFKSPESREVTLRLPSGKVISGMGIGPGVSLIVGGGYHGKSTLLNALERGIYSHIAGDGREYVITRSDAVKIRSEDGRSIVKVNISPFINNLPAKQDTTAFSTENASGSTSQAANVIEALESGSSLLLIDEDTSATNFMIRDRRMQELVAKEKEPITPFVEQAEALHRELGVSVILVVGGSGAYFDVADRVLLMDNYLAYDATSQAKAIAQKDRYHRVMPAKQSLATRNRRVLLKSSFANKGKEDRFKAKGLHTLVYGRETIDLSGLEQLVTPSQVNCLALMLKFAKDNLLDDSCSLQEIADKLYAFIQEEGLAALASAPSYPGDLALPRKQEFCAALNRFRSLKAEIK